MPAVGWLLGRPPVGGGGIKPKRERNTLQVSGCVLNGIIQYEKSGVNNLFSERNGRKKLMYMR